MDDFVKLLSDAIDAQDWGKVAEIKEKLNESKKPKNLFSDDLTLATGPLYETPPPKSNRQRQYRPTHQDRDVICGKCGKPDKVNPALLRDGGKYICNDCCGKPS